MVTFENKKCRMHFKYMNYPSQGLPFCTLRSYVFVKFEIVSKKQQYFRRDKEVTIACTSPIFAYHQHIAEVSNLSYRDKGKKKVMWDSFKATSRNSPTSTYGFQIRN
jgi:hypothetical protein